MTRETRLGENFTRLGPTWELTKLALAQTELSDDRRWGEDCVEQCNALDAEAMDDCLIECEGDDGQV